MYSIIINSYLVIAFLVSITFFKIMIEHEEAIGLIWNMETTEEQRNFIFNHPQLFRTILFISMIILGLFWPVTISTLIDYYKYFNK